MEKWIRISKNSSFQPSRAPRVNFAPVFPNYSQITDNFRFYRLLGAGGTFLKLKFVVWGILDTVSYQGGLRNGLEEMPLFLEF